MYDLSVVSFALNVFTNIENFNNSIYFLILIITIPLKTKQNSIHVHIPMETLIIIWHLIIIIIWRTTLLYKLEKNCNSKSLNLLVRYRYNEDNNNAIIFNHIDHQIIVIVFGQAQGTIIKWVLSLHQSIIHNKYVTYFRYGVYVISSLLCMIIVQAIRLCCCVIIFNLFTYLSILDIRVINMF